MRYLLCLALLVLACECVMPSAAQAWFPRLRARQTINLNVNVRSGFDRPYILVPQDYASSYSFAPRRDSRESFSFNRSAWDGFRSNSTSFQFQRSGGCGPFGCR